MKQNWHRQNAQLFKASFTQLAISSPFLTIFMTITVIAHFSVNMDDSQPNDCFRSTRRCTHKHMYTCTDIVSDSHRHKHTDTNACTPTHPHTWTYGHLHTHECMHTFNSKPFPDSHSIFHVLPMQK